MSASSDSGSGSSDCAKSAPPTSSKPPLSPTDSSVNLLPAPVVDEITVNCIFCLNSLPLDSMPLTGQYEPVAQLVPCAHYMHDQCLRPWTEVANTCPICRISFNEVNVLPHMNGPVLTSYQVKDKVQRVADHGVDIPLEELLDDDHLVGLPRDAARAWVAAWEALDADLEQPDTQDEDDELDSYYSRQAYDHMLREERMNRRRAVAAVQTGHGRNAFDEQLAAWEIPTTRPRTTFPHLEHQMSKESDSWKMMELAEEIENAKAKRRRSPDWDETMLALNMMVDADRDRDRRRFKRPRTKRDSQLPAINTRNSNNNGESSNSGQAGSATVGTPIGNTSDAGSPSFGGMFTSILAGIGKSQDIPIVSAADVSGRDLARMRPISPDRSSVTSPMSRSRSPPATYSPTSPPSSRPTSPIGERSRGRAIYMASSPTRTPAHSPERAERKKPWEVPRPTSPPVSRVQSRDGRPSTRQRSHSPEESIDRNNRPSKSQHIYHPPGPAFPSLGPNESSASDSDCGQRHKFNTITKERKTDIVNMVSAALEPLYPARMSREKYTEINKKISRRMYKFICEQNGAEDQQLWRQAIHKEVEKEMARL